MKSFIQKKRLLKNFIGRIGEVLKMGVNWYLFDLNNKIRYNVHKIRSEVLSWNEVKELIKNDPEEAAFRLYWLQLVAEVLRTKTPSTFVLDSDLSSYFDDSISDDWDWLNYDDKQKKWVME